MNLSMQKNILLEILFLNIRHRSECLIMVPSWMIQLEIFYIREKYIRTSAKICGRLDSNVIIPGANYLTQSGTAVLLPANTNN